MQHSTTLEINEVETEITVHFTNRFHEIEITQIIDVSTGESIAPDLFEDEVTATALASLYEGLASVADDEQIEVENTYNNI